MVKTKGAFRVFLQEKNDYDYDLIYSRYFPNLIWCVILMIQAVETYATAVQSSTMLIEEARFPELWYSHLPQ